MSNDEQPVRHITGKISVVFLLLLTPFIPLMLSLIEHLAFKTSRVESFCRDIGIHDELSMLYEPIVDFLMSW